MGLHGLQRSLSCDFRIDIIPQILCFDISLVKGFHPGFLDQPMLKLIYCTKDQQLYNANTLFMTRLILDCSGRFLDPKNGEMTYTAPTYQDNRHCIIVIRNTLLRNHVIEVTFIKFDLEESDDCEYDSLKILTGEHEGM